MIETDIAIIGGGMVGATLALALVEHGVAVVVVEAFETGEPAADSPPALRVSAINAASSRLFARLGVWQGMLARRVKPYQRMRVWDAGSIGHVDFGAADVHAPQLGHIIENWVIQQSLRDALRAHSSVRWLAPVSPERFTLSDDRALVELNNGETLSARLVVAADGARSRMRDMAAIGVDRKEYGQAALVSCVETALGHEDTAWQRFLGDGPLAFLPLYNGMSSIVWSTLPEQAERLRDMPEAAFRRELGTAFDHRLGDILACGERALFPLARQDARAYVGERIALVGDAAHVVHPLAGQGVNLGLMDAAALAEVVGGVIRRGRDPGLEVHLLPYQRWRRGQNALMATAMDGFDRLFRNDSVAIRLLRGVGFDIANGVAPVKTLLARHAMGDGFDMPALVRPVPSAGAPI